MKKIMKVVGVLSFVCFSFYYTDSAVDIIKRNDPIMKDIISVINNYEVSSVDAILIDNSVVPGMSGMTIDIDKSYSKMKQLGEFNKNLLVFKEIYPVLSVDDNRDKYIVRGNSNKNEVSLIITFEDTSYLEEILEILNNKKVKATIFLEHDIIIDSVDAVRLFALNNYRMELLGDNYKYDRQIINYGNMIYKNIGTNKAKYCFSVIEDKDLLKTCNNENFRVVIPSIDAIKYPYNDVKKNLENGSIIRLSNNSSTLRELNSVINYIMQKGKKIVSLDKLLEE